MELKFSAVTRKGPVTIVTLSRPEVYNALHIDAHFELNAVFDDFCADPEQWVAIVTGAGDKAFCAGNDLKWQAAGGKRGWDKGGFAGLTSRFDCDKPIIARVNGHAVGLGATIALLCDIIIAADHAKIGDPHVNAGLVAGDGGALIWPQLIGFARAKEYLFTGDLMTAAEAERIGLINHVVPADQLDEKVYGLARRLAGGAMRSIRWTKQAINIPLRQLAHSMMDLSLSLETQSNLTKDHQEAVWAFAQKRRPNFTGR